jgi:hypothetical protein
MNKDKHKELLDACQSGISERETENEVPRVFVLLYRLRWHIRANGYLATAKRIFLRLIPRFRRANMSGCAFKSAPGVMRPALNLQPGEMVEVLSEDEIRQTLDGKGKDRGLAFMSEMRVYCGKRLRVLKPVKNIMVDEFASTARLRSVKDAVLLEGAICNGAGIECDRSCFFFWKESWLKRVEHEQIADESDSVYEITHEEHENRSVNIGTFPF